MTDTTTDPQTDPATTDEPLDLPTPEATDTDATDDADTTDEAADPALRKARKDAAGYRERLRTAETDRDTARQHADKLRARILEHELNGSGVKLAALEAAGFNLAEAVSADGDIDRAMLDAAIQQARDKFGIPKPSRFQGSADSGPRGATAPVAPTAGWGDLLDPGANPQARRANREYPTADAVS